MRGAFATAVALGLASEIFPDDGSAGLGRRIIHGLRVVLGTLAVLCLVDGGQRLGLYRWRARRRWSMRIAELGGLLSFAVDSHDPARAAPQDVRFVVRKPAGDLVMLWPDPASDDGFVMPYPSGCWVHLVEQPYAAGRYEVRVYAVPEFYELTRATFDI